MKCIYVFLSISALATVVVPTHKRVLIVPPHLITVCRTIDFLHQILPCIEIKTVHGSSDKLSL